MPEWLHRVEVPGGQGSGPGGNRTHDLGIKSPLLYQLSYMPGVSAYPPGTVPSCLFNVISQNDAHGRCEHFQQLFPRAGVERL